jgi:hypothetical protein
MPCFFSFPESCNWERGGRIPVRNVVTTSAMRRFAGLRDRVLERKRNVIHDEY